MIETTYEVQGSLVKYKEGKKVQTVEIEGKKRKIRGYVNLIRICGLETQAFYLMKEDKVTGKMTCFEIPNYKGVMCAATWLEVLDDVWENKIQNLSAITSEKDLRAIYSQGYSDEDNRLEKEYLAIYERIIRRDLQVVPEVSVKLAGYIQRKKACKGLKERQNRKFNQLAHYRKRKQELNRCVKEKETK